VGEEKNGVLGAGRTVPSSIQKRKLEEKKGGISK